MLCDDLEHLFQNGEPCVVVTSGERVGLIMRDEFGHMMSGPFGYGRALWGRRPIAAVTDWAPLRVPASSPVPSVVNALRSRSPDRRYDDVLVDLEDGGLGRAPAAVLLDALAQQFTHRATHDELTGLINRTHFLELLAEACRDTAHSRVLLAVVDLDGMKRINDSHGHLAGDAVITRAARHLSDTVRPGDIVGRLGADEFVVLTRLPAYLDAAAAAADLGARSRLSVTAPDGMNVTGLRVRASVGVAVSGATADPSTLLSEADMALYRAKQAGGDRVEVTVDAGTELAYDVNRVDRSVLDAIDHDELRVWYQPIMRIGAQDLAGVEALVRWEHPTAGLLAPARFLPGAKRAGHLPAMDRWVLTRAATDIARRPGSETVSVNLSPATLATDFDVMVIDVLDQTGLPPDRLILELPEDADLDTLANAAPRLERLRAIGVGLVLDDMGAGSTSLRHLSTLTIGGLKIDSAFVAGMLHNPRDHTVVKLLADLGRGLGLPVTAEGVESPAQLAALAALDIDYVQGYHLGRPRPLDELRSATRAKTEPAARPLRAKPEAR